MLRLKQGDAVRIVARNANSADARSGLYYNYYRGLLGTVFKLYGKGETTLAAVDIDVASLPADVARRHLEITEEMQPERSGRRGALNDDAPFRLRYVILVAVTDLERQPARSHEGVSVAPASGVRVPA